MTAFVALGIAVVALVLSSVGVVAWIASRRSRRTFDALAERLSDDSRLEQLTAQTLMAMRQAVRRAGGGLL